MSNNGRIPLHEVGGKVKLSSDGVNYRIKKMIEMGLITGYVPLVNYSLLGYTVYGVLMNIHNLSKEKENKLESFLKNNKNVLWAVKTIGKYNLLMYLSVKESEELHQTLLKMREMFSSDIREYETLIAYEEYKHTYLPKDMIKKS
jgi:Lrp/AsnC family leucine-responsive transcriptional regulator